MFESIDLKEKIDNSRKKSNSNFNIDAYYSILKDEIDREKQILTNISNTKFKIQNLDISKLSLENIYDISDIKEIAIKFRLRFLPSKHYKSDLPVEAILKIKEISLIKEEIELLDRSSIKTILFTFFNYFFV